MQFLRLTVPTTFGPATRRGRLALCRNVVHNQVMTNALATPALTVDLAEATTALAQARVALTTEARNAHLDTVQECTGWALAEPAARKLYNEAAWMR